MPDRDWGREIGRAGDWIKARWVEAIDRAYPEGGLWAQSGRVLKFDDRLEMFRGAFVEDVKGGWITRDIPWRRDEPTFGELLRRIGVDGRFAHTSLVHAARVAMADEALAFLPDGLSITINPGYLWVKTSRKDKGSRIDVPGESLSRSGTDLGSRSRGLSGPS